MKKICALALGLLAIATSQGAFAGEIEFSAEAISVSDDLVTTYLGEAVIRAPKETLFQVKSKAVKTVNGAEVHEGDVEIIIEKMRVSTNKATITRDASGTIVIKMDNAESRDLE